MFFKSYAAIRQWIFHFIHLQIFLNLVSLPILISWGLALSWVSPIANLLFAPFLTAFLLLSSLIFFSSLCHLPNTWIIQLLEWVTRAWDYILSLEQRNWLFGFIKAPMIILTAIPMITFLLLHHRYTHNAKRNAIALCILYGAILIFFKYGYPKPCCVNTVAHQTGNLTIAQDNDQIIVLDPGLIGRNQSAPNWIQYRFIPELTLLTGQLSIDHMVALQPNIFLFKALTTLCKKISVKNLYIPKWKGMLARNTWFAYKDLRKTVEQTGCTFHFIENNTITIQVSHQTKLTISPLNSCINYGIASYPAVHIGLNSNEQVVDIYSFKYQAQKVKSTHTPTSLLH